MVTTLAGATATSSFGPAWGRRSVAGLIEFLQRERGHGETDLDAALDSYAAGHAGNAILISDLLTPKFEQGIRRLLDRRFEVTILHVLAPKSPPADERRPDADRPARTATRSRSR